MLTVTDDELLRLARKAWPDEECLEFTGEDDNCTVNDGYGYTLAKVMWHSRAPQALHAALAVLAGEDHAPNADLAAALESNSDLRDKLDRALVGMESFAADLALERRWKHDANGRAQKLVSVAELAVAALMRHGHGDEARAVSEALKKAIEG